MTARRKRARRPIVDPRLRPFIDAIAELLLAQEERLAEARRTVREIATSIESSTTNQGDKHMAGRPSYGWMSARMPWREERWKGS